MFFRRIYFLLAFPLASSCLLANPSNESPKFPLEKIQKNDSRLIDADEYFDAGLYPQAVSLYREILEDCQNKTNVSNLTITQLAIQTRFHLAQAHFAMENLLEAIPLLRKNIDTIDTSIRQHSPVREIQLNSLYLLALIHKALKQYADASEIFQTYLEQGNPSELAFYEEALFEKGLVNFLSCDYPEAEKQFLKLEVNQSKPRLHSLAQIYLGRICLVQEKYKEALSFFSGLTGKLPADDILNKELAYFQGEASFQSRNFPRAAEFFEKALPMPATARCSWHADTLYHLGWCYLNIGDDPLKSLKDQEKFLKKAEETFQKLLNLSPEERVYLALGQCLLTEASRLKKDDAYAQAETLLSNQKAFVSKEAQSQALLLRAGAAPSYHLREKFYWQLTQEQNSNSSFYAHSWFMRAMNDFEYGLLLSKSAKLEEQEESKKAFERSSSHFAKTFELLKDGKKDQAGAALKYQALALSYSDISHSDLKAFNLLEVLMTEHSDKWQAMNHPEEILYLHGFFASRLSEKGEKEKFIPIAQQSLKAVLEFAGSKFGDLALLQLGAMHYRHGNYPETEAAYLALIESYPSSSFAGEAWLWAACCADKLQKDSKIGKERRRLAFENFPESPYAAEAYFSFYTYQDYLQGERNAIKHLQSFIEKYPKTPLLIEAYYLLGLDYKRDRKTPEGKWIRKKSLTDAIDAFQEVEATFEAFANKNLIPTDRFDYYVSVFYRATLERALANLAIAEESQGAKRQIYLEYAEEVFKQLLADFQKPDHPYAKLLFHQQTYPSLYEESSYWLAQTYIKEQKNREAEKILNEILEKYSQNKITRGYYLSRIWYEQGRISMHKQEYILAQQNFQNAEDAAKGNVLSTDQKLDLWIQQSLCYSHLHHYDQAILLLSKVVNHDAISSLRLKAMYLRAETYELQGRPELARKQLESMSKKGGIWAQKAKEKLEKDYGY